MYLLSFFAIFVSLTLCVIFIFGSAQGEAFDYETAVQTCYLDGELVNRDPGILKLGQSYWVSGKRVELGCPRKGLCSRLEIGKLLDRSHRAWISSVSNVRSLVV